MADKQSGGGVRFSSVLIGIAGLFVGMCISLGIPAVLINAGDKVVLTSGWLASVIIVAVIIGGGVATVSAFFGIIIPSKVGGSMPWDKPKNR